MPAAFEDWYMAGDEYQDIEPSYERGETFEVGNRSFSDSDEAIDYAIRSGHPVYSGSAVYFDPDEDMNIFGY